jgi:AhpD family alkylhydroperoxidase
MQQEFYMKIYTIPELYTALFLGFRTVSSLLKSRRNGDLSAHAIERIMLAVTAVNGCEVCSYAHTRLALEQGMSQHEIQMMLLGDVSDVPEEEAAAIFFAQHYADSRGHPTMNAWHRLVDIYGQGKAQAILGAIRMIMIGNVSGIPLSALHRRVKRQPVKKSSLPYEIGMLVAMVPFTPAAMVHAMFAGLLRRPLL